MPRATADATATERKELKTLPEGFVEVRRLTYGEKIERRAMVSYMKVEAQKGKKDFSGEMQLVNEKATVFDFQRCIIDHNLEDENGTKLNFGNVADIRRLDPRVGEEIDDLLGELNNFEEDEGN